MAGNTCHMLLARIAGPDTPPGAAGISLFLVPAVLPNGEPNDVEIVGLNRKMGHRALPNCAWNLGGGGGGALGWLVGPPHGGLGCMFMMMNAMRIEVGLGAACLGKRGLMESLLYAAEREQGGRRIVHHADVKRMLLLQKAYAEGSFGLVCLAASLEERTKAVGAAGAAAGAETAAEEARAAGAVLEVLVEVVKSWPSEWALEANKLAIQVFGGAGYVNDFPVEQLYVGAHAHVSH